MDSAIKCAACGHKGMEPSTGITSTVLCGDVEEILEGLTGWVCPACAESQLDELSSDRHAEAGDRVVLAWRARQPAVVRGIRKKLGLTQSKAAEIFGGGVNAFSEYERGVTQPSKSTMALLRLLDKHPELLREVA